MKIFTAPQIRNWDAHTIQHEPISSINLMERASQAFVNWFTNQFQETKQPVKIFAGIGNNGGDGLAIARLLSERGYSAEVFAIRFSDNPSADFLENEKRWQGKLVNITSDSGLPQFGGEDIIIDGIFGSGLSRPISGWLAKIINHLNKQKGTKISIDIASGLFADSSNQPDDAILQPDFTISFQTPKLAFMMPQNEHFVGEWHVVNIGLSAEYEAHTTSPYHYTSKAFVLSLLKKRTKFSHKGTYGHLLVMAGSHGKIGAAVLSIKSALRTGAGLVTAYIPSCGYQIMQSSVPEAMCLVDESERELSRLPELGMFSTIAIGPGIGQSEETLHMLKALFQKWRKPLVLDADALNLLSKNEELKSHIPPNSILTPHPKEFQRLAGKSENDFVRLAKQQAFSEKYNCYVVLKGAHTSVSCPDGSVHFNSTGNNGMATAGSGDVLTGVISSLLSQGYSSQEASIFGVYLHGLAGDLAAKKVSEPSLIASDLIDHIGKAYLEL